MDYVKEIAEHLIPILAMILAGLASVLTPWLARKLAALLGLKVTAEQQKLIADIATRAVHYADQWATAKVKNDEPRPGGAAKLEAALGFAMPLIRQARLPELARDELVKAIESALGAKRPAP